MREMPERTGDLPINVKSYSGLSNINNVISLLVFLEKGCNFKKTLFVRAFGPKINSNSFSLLNLDKIVLQFRINNTLYMRK